MQRAAQGALVRLRAGKRGGLRILYYWAAQDGTIYMLYAYSKREQADLTKSQVATLARLIREELQ